LKELRALMPAVRSNAKTRDLVRKLRARAERARTLEAAGVEAVREEDKPVFWDGLPEDHRVAFHHLNVELITGGCWPALDTVPVFSNSSGEVRGVDTGPARLALQELLGVDPRTDEVAAAALDVVDFLVRAVILGGKTDREILLAMRAQVAQPVRLAILAAVNEAVGDFASVTQQGAAEQTSLDDLRRVGVTKPPDPKWTLGHTWVVYHLRASLASLDPAFSALDPQQTYNRIRDAARRGTNIPQVAAQLSESVGAVLGAKGAKAKKRESETRADAVEKHRKAFNKALTSPRNQGRRA
jgi:hypothetical protein